MGAPISRSIRKPRRGIDDDLVVAIVDELGGIDGKELVGSREVTRAAVVAIIQREIEHLAVWNELYGRDAQKRLAEYAEELDGLLAAVEIKLKNPPKIFERFLFGPWPHESNARVSHDIIAAAIVSDQEQTLQKLARMRAACQLELERQPPRHDFMKRYCAAVAYLLMHELSHRRIASSLGSPFRNITASVFYALTGEPVHDLKRQCESFLRLIGR
jgi:hypothetical protein